MVIATTTTEAAAARLLLAVAAMSFVLVGQMGLVQAQTCSSQLTNLNVCAPFVVPGNSATPNADCCGALQAVENDCLCNTLRIASRIPSQCNLPPVNCAR